jgi:hypothetical protein
MKYNQQIIDCFRDIKTVADKHPGRLTDVLSCFNQNQYDCKTWLVDCLNQYPYHFKNKTQDSINIAIMGGWYGLMAKLLRDNFTVKPINEITSYDFDPYARTIGNIFFPHINFQTKNVLELDISQKNYSIVINTSCEHMLQEDLYKSMSTAPTKTLFVLQSNNYRQLQQHVNCVDSLDSFVKQYSDVLEKIRFYEKDMGKYTRYMLIGVKK